MTFYEKRKFLEEFVERLLETDMLALSSDQCEVVISEFIWKTA